MTNDADAPEAAEPLQAAAPEAQENDRTLVFEQPLNERMRTFLRLDFLYSQALYHNEMGSEWGTRAAVTSLIDILAIITRSDVRSDALKELERQLTALGEFQSKPGVDTNRLKSLIGNVTRLRGELLNAGVANLQPLKESDFLNAVKHRSSIPGGTCEFDLPDYLFWLSQPDEARTRAFNQWLAVLRPLCDAVSELIWLTRQNGRTRQETAPGGSFTMTFERENPLQLLRIALPASTGLYPEVSGSHHRCNVRFLSWKGLSERPTQASGDVKFLLTCCS
ncbi:MAG TPA: cell division protein ZapD [Steroidobacteraceae bacterium]|jgi:cell division protein ZapD|nr:cell division protein ZapD [Steroidobacteraceae bacterium]HTL92098.1 cell division protein ZapD [Steroidobacteraceae bacterium]